MIRPALLLLLLLSATPAQAQRSLTIKRFDATIVVTPDGSVDVTESITAGFTGSWNGIFRTVPVEYRTPQGFNWTLRLDLLGVTDGDGRPLEVESSRERHYIKYKIRVPGAVDATRTVLIHYRAANGLRFLEDHDELYWNVTGDEWDVPIEVATARIELPAAATGVRAIAFNGVYGSTARDAVVKTEGTTVRVTMPHRLDFHEGLTAVVGWDKGLVSPPSEAEKAVGVLASNWPLGIPILVFLAMFTLWRRVGRDPRRLPVAVQYEPPDSITPAEAGTLMDESADMRDITATVTDLAVRGHLRIEEREQSALFGLITRQEYIFHRLEPAGLPPLVAHEEQVFRGIFARGKNEVKLSELENEFYKILPAVKTQIFKRLIDRGLYRSRPDRVKSHWRVGAIVVVGLIISLGVVLSAKFQLTPVPFILAALVTGLIVFLFSRYMPARTTAGARTLERLLGFEEFLSRVEKENYERVVKTPEMFERYLPFAMAFGVERKWAKAFQNIYREPPKWYVGSNSSAFDLGRLSNSLSDLSDRAQSVMTSSPRSSSGSGFSSGGSSGGGSGGGGGGGW
ncbi:MAG TPA: DUF2207 domain-containing protein [Gemmatimonadales bacterium]|nr:DUF2207 domain-containing protein [Gemmatimonadales bacterium]